MLHSVHRCAFATKIAWFQLCLAHARQHVRRLAWPEYFRDIQMIAAAELPSRFALSISDEDPIWRVYLFN